MLTFLEIIQILEEIGRRSIGVVSANDNRRLKDSQSIQYLRIT